MPRPIRNSTVRSRRAPILGLERGRGAIRTVLAVIGVGAVALCGAEGASAYIGNNTGGIDQLATHSQGGALVRTTGSIGCSKGERISIRVTVTQPATKARARASWRSRCTGEIQRWQARARARGGTHFEPGPGKVCAAARTRAADRLTDRKRWCERVSVSGGF